MSRGTHSLERERAGTDRAGWAIEVAGALGALGAAIVTTMLVRQMAHWPRVLTLAYLLGLTVWAFACGVTWLYGVARREEYRP